MTTIHWFSTPFGRTAVCLIKSSSPDLLRHTIKAVASGGILNIGVQFRKAIISQFWTQRPAGLAPEGEDVVVLTPSEWEVLKLMAEGGTSKDIADALALSEATVKKHVQSIKAKLRASGWTNAANAGVADGPTLSRPLPLIVHSDQRAV